MTGSSDARTGENGGERRRVTPLERSLDAAIESERRRLADARQGKNRAHQLARATQPGLARATQPGLARATQPGALQAPTAPEPGSEAAHRRGTPRPAHLPPAPPSRRGLLPEAERSGPPPEPVRGWVRACIVALSLVAIPTTFLIPVAPALPGRVPPGGVVAPPAPTSGTLSDRAGNSREPSPELATGEPHHVDDELKSRSAALHPSPPQSDTKARAPLHVEAKPSGAVPATPARSEPSRSPAAPATPAAPAAQQAQAAEVPVVAEKRRAIVTVNDLFGIGGDEPLPPEALEAPRTAAPKAKPRLNEHDDPASPSLFYHQAPY